MILVFIPYHANKRYCIEHVLDWLEQADLPDTEVLMRWHRGTFGEPGAVKAQREFARQEALRLGATHLFFVGADTIPPLDALPKLLAHNLPLVSGRYYGRHEGSNQVPGMDCALIAREVLEQISWLEWAIPDDDYPFYERAKALGYEVYFDPNVHCRHYETSELYF